MYTLEKTIPLPYALEYTLLLLKLIVCGMKSPPLGDSLSCQNAKRIFQLHEWKHHLSIECLSLLDPS